MNVKLIFTVLLSFVILLSCNVLTAFAEVELPEGAVKGLPEKISAMDSNGNSVSSETGEYFFHVENMTYGEVYTKYVQLMNLRDDAAYNIYFYVEPKFKTGEIDLEKECICNFYLDGEQFFKGTVTGKGNIDLTENIKDLGYYEPGDSHTLSCSVAWVGMDGDYYIDEGHRIVSNEGIVINRDKDGNRHVEGEIEFKWIFYASVDENYKPPYTGLLSIKNSYWLILIGITVFLIIIMLILLAKKKKDEKKKNTGAV